MKEMVTYLKPEQIEFIKKQASKNNVSCSEMIRKCVSYYMLRFDYKVMKEVKVDDK